MPKNDATPEGRSQKLTSPDMVMIDRKTCHEQGKLIGQSIDQLQTIRHCEIMLTSLESHLYGLADRERDEEFEISKGILGVAELRYDLCGQGMFWLPQLPHLRAIEIIGWIGNRNIPKLKIMNY